MSIQATGMRAYTEALQHFKKVQGSLQEGMPVSGKTLFAKTLDHCGSRRKFRCAGRFYHLP